MYRRGLFILAWIMFFVLLPSAAHAQEPLPENDDTCTACHDHQYYQYDNGKWFCLCEAPMHCVYCHSGQAGTLDKDTAHVGLVLYPTRREAERCQVCHAQDTLARVNTFDQKAGIDSVPINLKTAAAVEFEPERLEAPLAPLLVRFRSLSPARLVGLFGVGIALAACIVFAFFCWQADCAKKTQI